MKLYNTILRKIAHFQTEHPWMALLIILIITAIMIQGSKDVRTVASLENMMPPDIEEIKAFNTLRDYGLGQDMIGIVIEINKDSTLDFGINNVLNYEVYEYAKLIKDTMLADENILEAYAYSDLIDPDNNFLVEINSKDLSNFVNIDLTKTIIIASTDISADDTRMNLLVNKIKNDLDNLERPSNIKLKLTGTPIIQQELGKLIAQDRTSTQWISTLFVFLIVMLIFGTFSSALVPIIIVTISVTGLYGIMGFVGLPISTLAGGVAAMVVGIGIDYAIHLMNKFKYERKKGMDVKQAIEMAVVDTGTALTATSFTTIAAFLAFLSGAMPEMQRFGILMAIGVAYSLVASIFGLPALLVIEEKMIYYFKSKAKFGIEGELRLTSKSEACPVGYKMIKAKEIRHGQRILVKDHVVDKVKFDKRKYRK